MPTRHERKMSKVKEIRALWAEQLPSPDGVQVKRSVRMSATGCVVVTQRVMLSTTPSRVMAVED